MHFIWNGWAWMKQEGHVEEYKKMMGRVEPATGKTC